MTSFAMLLLLVAAGTTTSAQAKDVSHQKGRLYYAVAPDDVSSLLRSKGLDFQQLDGQNGRVVFKLQLQTYHVALFLAGCDQSKCSNLQLYSGFELDSPAPVSVINDWNRSKRFSRAYIDHENDAVIEADLDLEGGVGLEQISVFIATFRASVSAFASHIGYGH